MTGVLVVVAQPDADDAEPTLSPMVRDASGGAVDYLPTTSATTVFARVGPDSVLRLLEVGRDDAVETVSTDRVWASSWGVVQKIDEMSVVHVVRPATRAGELVVLAAKALGKPLVMSEVTVATSRLGVSLGMLQLADALVVASHEEADRFPHLTVHVVGEGNGAATRLLALYAEVVGEADRP